MRSPIVPQSKIGTPFQSPNWRYQALFCPDRFGFAKFCSRIEPNATSLVRLIDHGVAPVESFGLPDYVKKLNSKLAPNLKEQLLRVWTKYYYKNRTKKLTFNVNGRKAGLLNWNVKRIDKINDEYFKRLIKHGYGYEVDEHMGDAIKFVKNPQNDMTCRWINYSIYGGKTDKELALQWKKPMRFIEAVRMIFFDYSGWPKDKLVQYSLIRQMVSNNELDDTDYHAFRRIYDLGELGLRSILGHQLLDDRERTIVKQYLAGAGVDNLLDQRYTISNLKESVSFNRSVSEYANVGLRRLQMEQQAAVMRLTAQRMEKEMGLADLDKIEPQDTELMGVLQEMMAREKTPKFQSYIDLRKEDVTVIPEP